MLPSHIRAEDILLNTFDIRPHKHLWLYGNVRLLMGHTDRIAYAPGIFEYPWRYLPREIDEIEKRAEEIVLAGWTLITGIHNEVHQRAAVVPLRWGAPRILVIPGGFEGHLGKDLKDEPFRLARLWRYQFDPQTDLVISSRKPQSPMDRHRVCPQVDRIIRAIGKPGLQPQRIPA